MNLEFKHISNQLGTRLEANEIRLGISDALKKNQRVIFDFSEVDVITNSFADECFGKLLLEFDLKELKSKSTFINSSEFVSSTIANAINSRIVELSRNTVQVCPAE